MSVLKVRPSSRSSRRRDQLPPGLHRVLLAVYTMRPSARAFRRGLADRMRVAALVHEVCGGVVKRGPFAGLVFPFVSPDAAAKCVGSYECELHDEVSRIISAGYTSILNVGCAEGFYAVGLARAMPEAVVHAHDTSPEALVLCRELAEANGLEVGRLSYGGEVTHKVLNDLAGPGVLVLADIEGGEALLLDPVAAPRLADADMLVELHETAVPGVETLLRQRFAQTHTIREIDSTSRRDGSRYPELMMLSPDDKLLAMFERPVVMRWLVLKSVRG